MLDEELRGAPSQRIAEGIGVDCCSQPRTRDGGVQALRAPVRAALADGRGRRFLGKLADAGWDTPIASVVRLDVDPRMGVWTSTRR